MLDIELFRQDPERVRGALRLRQLDPAPVNEVIQLDSDRRERITEVEKLKAERNTVSKEIGKMKDPDARAAKIDAMRSVGDRISGLDQRSARSRRICRH